MQNGKIKYVHSIGGFKENNRVNKGDLFYTPPTKKEKSKLKTTLL